MPFGLVKTSSIGKGWSPCFQQSQLSPRAFRAINTSLQSVYTQETPASCSIPHTGPQAQRKVPSSAPKLRKEIRVSVSCGGTRVPVSCGGCHSQSNLIEYKRQMQDHKHSAGFRFLKVGIFQLGCWWESPGEV